MRDLRRCSHCNAWREKLRACEHCGEIDLLEIAPKEPNIKIPKNSPSLRRMLRNKGRR